MMNNIMDNTIEIIMNKFFGIVKEKYNDARSEKALKKACESSSDDKSDIIEANMRLISDALQQDLNQSVMYTEDELKKIFDDAYDNYIKDDTSDVIKDELWERFRLYMPQYLKRYEEALSVGEKRILQEVRSTEDKLKVLLENNGEILLFNKEAKKELEKLNELKSLLPYDNNMARVDFNRIYGVRINPYQPISTYYNNCFDFDILKKAEESEDRNSYDLDELNDVFELRFLIKNIGNTDITKISVENVNIMYASTQFDSSMTDGLSGGEIIAVHTQKVENSHTIIPNAEDYVHLILTADDESLLESGAFNDLGETGRLYMSFTLGLKGKTETKYVYYLFLSKRIPSNDNDYIYGGYTIDDVIFAEIQ